MAAQRPAVGPDRFDLLAIILGVVIGICAGPMVMGRFAPDFYEYIFVGGDELVLPAEDVGMEAKQQAGEVDQVEPPTVDEVQVETEVVVEDAAAELDVVQLKAQTKRRHDITLAMHGVILSVCVLMVFDILLAWLDGVRMRVFRGRLIWARHLLVGIWLVLFFAQPTMYLEVSLWFILIVLTVVLLAGILTAWRVKPPEPVS